MASALSDFMRKNVKFAYGGIGLPFAALDIKNVLDSDNKFKALAKTLKDLILIRVSLVGTFMAVGAAVRALVKDTGSLDAALKRLSEVQHFQRLFAPFVGGAKAARKEVADLIQFAAHTPFKFEGVAGAALSLKRSTRGEFAGEPALKKVGDAAAVSGNSIEDSADAVGHFYEALHNGEPINQTVEAMRQMGLISTVAATNLERLAESGADTRAMAGQLTSALSESRGGMEAFANDLEAVAAAREKAVEGAQVAFGTPFTEQEVQTTKNYTEAIVAITPALATAGEALSKFVGGIENATSSFVKWAAKSGIGEAAIKLLITAVVALTAVFTAIGVAAIPGFIGLIATLMVGVEGAIAAFVAWGVAMGVSAAAMGALGAALEIVANIAASVGIAAPFLAAAGAVLALGVAIKGVIDHSRNFNKVLGEEMAAHAEVIKNINSHIAAIQTLADKYQVVSESIQQQIKDQKELNDLQSKRQALKQEIATSDPLIAWRKKFDLAELDKKIDQQEKKISLDRKARQRAERTPAIAGPEREALIQSQTRRQLMLEEQKLEERMSAQPGQRPELLRERAVQLAERAKLGKTGLEKAETVALRQSELSAGKGDVESALSREREQLAAISAQKGKKEERKKLKEQIATNEAVLDKIEAEILAAGLEGGDTSVGLAARAQQLQHAINAKAAKARGDKQVVAREEALAGGVTAGENAPAELMALHKRAGMAKQFEQQSPEMEIEARRKQTEAREEDRSRFITEFQTHLERGIATAGRIGPPGQKQMLSDLHDFVGKFEDLRKLFPEQKAAQLAREQVGTDIMKNIPMEAFKPIADSLTRVGGGGGVGGVQGDPMLIAAKRMNDLQLTANQYLASIDDHLRAGQATEPESTEGTQIPGEGAIPGTTTTTPPTVEESLAAGILPPAPAPGTPVQNPAPKESISNTIPFPIGTSMTTGEPAALKQTESRQSQLGVTIGSAEHPLPDNREVFKQDQAAKQAEAATSREATALRGGFGTHRQVEAERHVAAAQIVESTKDLGNLNLPNVAASAPVQVSDAKPVPNAAPAPTPTAQVAAAQAFESVKNIGDTSTSGNEPQRAAATPVAIPVPAGMLPMPNASPAPVPQEQTNNLLNNIYLQNKKANESLGAVATNTSGMYGTQ